MNNPPTNWKDVQDIARRIESALGSDCDVKSPDHLVDRVTGRRREIDFTIRSTVGSQSVLVIGECRKRAAKVDVTFVEQVVQKRADVKADRAIIVSTTGFTKGGRQKADHENISLMTLTEALEDKWPPWLALSSMEVLQRRFQVMQLRFERARNGGPEEGLVEIGEFRTTDKIILLSDGAEWGTVNQLVSRALREHNVVDKLDPKNEPITDVVPIELRGIPLYLRVDGELVQIHRVVAELKLWAESTRVPIQAFQYASDDGQLVADYAEARLALPDGDEASREARLYFVKGDQGTGAFLEVDPKEDS